MTSSPLRLRQALITAAVACSVAGSTAAPQPGTSILAPCNASEQEQHLILQGGQLRAAASGTCLDGTCADPVRAGCHPLPFVPCANTPALQWALRGSTIVSLLGNGTTCLDANANGVGPAVGAYRCDGLVGQQWAVDPSTQSIRTLALPGQGPRCLTDSVPPPPPPPGPITLDRAGAKDKFFGLGAISGGGATTRLLVDYPPAQQSQILDYLFKPNFGAGLQTLKVEIGGDCLSTDGSESSHMRTNESIDLSVGYEWWLMTEAKRRNPNIQLYGLPWAFPGWVGNDPQTGAVNNTATPFDHPEQTVRYVVEWVRGAKTQYNLDIDFVGVWNESPSNADYVKLLRRTLDATGYSGTRIVAQDGGAQICTALAQDKEYAAAVDIIGLHYPGDFGDWFAPCTALGKPVWASEESSSYDDLNGAACWARVVHSHYARRGITSSIMWNLIGSYYPGTSWYASSLLTANQPWSGWYGVRGAGGEATQMPAVWATAHVTQFSEVGWKYLAVGSGSGELAQGGYYTTLVDGTTGNVSLFVVKNSLEHAACTRPALPPSEGGVKPETVTFVLAPSMGVGPTAKLACWRSNFELETPILFEQQPDVEVADGKFVLDVALGDYYTISTVQTASRGSFATPVPPSQPRSPIPVTDDFESTAVGQQPRLWSQMTAAWEVRPDAQNGSNQVLRQMAPQLSISSWPGHFTMIPGTVVGMREWQDIAISTSFRLPSTSATACIGTRADWTIDVGVVLCIGGTGYWELSYGNSLAGSDRPALQIVNGTVRTPPQPSVWSSLSLTTLGATANAEFNGAPLVSNLTIRDIDTGFVMLGTTVYQPTEFDNVAVRAVGTRWSDNPPVPAGCPPPSSNPVGHRLYVRACERNGVSASDQNFLLLPDWRLQHAASGLCAAADGSAPGSTVSLQVCNASSPLQLWQNDYSNIHHGQVPLTLQAYGVVLVGSLDGRVRTETAGWKGNDAWASWTFFDSTGQLRSQRTPRVASFPTKCLALCTDSAEISV